MAIHKPVELDSGVDVPGAYFRIENFSGNKTNTQVWVSVYKDAASAVRDPETNETAKPPITTLDFTMPTPLGDVNLLQAAYDMLMALPSFEGGQAV